MTDNSDACPHKAGDSRALHRMRAVGIIERLTRCFLGLVVIVIIIGLLYPSVRQSGKGEASRERCRYNLRDIARALHNYESIHHALPPACTIDADGKPLHSWRTLILPYLDQQELYNTIDLSKSWDDPANAEAYKTAMPIFQCPRATCPANHATYLAIVAPKGCFRLTEPRLVSEITDDMSETLMVIEVPSDQSVHWMCPKDADEQLVLGLGPECKLHHPGGTMVGFVDGSVGFLTVTTPAAERRALISIAGRKRTHGIKTP